MPPALADAIVARSGGNPFFAEELLAAGPAELPGRLRDLLLQRVARLEPATQGLLRLAAAAGRDVSYPLLRALASVPEPDVRGSLRQAVEHEVLIPDQAAGTFRFRHPLLAEAVYSTILPGEREELHARLAEELSRTAAAPPAEVAPHWAAAGRAGQALTASVEAARQAEAEALAHLERALALWPAVPGAATFTGFDLARLCSWAAELAGQTGASSRAAELARRAIELRALTALGSDLAYLGRGDEGLARLRQAVRLAGEIGDPMALQRAYITLTDVLTMLGRPRESAGVGETGLAAVRGYGVEVTVLAANWIEALLAIGDWDEAERASVTALRSLTASYSYMPLILRADVEIGRGQFDAAREHLDAALATLREDRGLGLYDAYRAELALWERRWADAAQAIDDGLTRAQPEEAAQIRVQLCAKGLRAQAELAALARARRDDRALGAWLDRARELLTVVGRAAAEASPITPNAAGWHLLARAEHDRLDLAQPDAGPPASKRTPEEALGLTPREADVLAVLARGYTNREIATTLVISVKTAGIHVSHILRKLDAPNRLEAAAIAHRLERAP